MANISDHQTAGITNAYKLLKNRFNQILHKNASLGRSQKFLQQRFDQVSQENRRLCRELQRQQENCNAMARDVGRISTEKSQIYAELENAKFQREVGDLVLDQCHDEINEHKKALERERFQKDLGELLLDQYRDEIEEQKKTLSEKEEHIEACKQSVAAAYSEISTLRAQILYLKQRLAVGEEDICTLACKLENSNGETARQRTIVAKVEKERKEAMDGCYYYQTQIGKLKATYDELESRVNALSTESSIEASGARQRRRAKRRRRRHV
ncbi:hypothetical protein FALBO_3028 [Fusarium albosuccineum]|uniref:Uncharacterized protein n=1 Tax=Fusarium albosuccineum TaxID=1237068 RepID=A0A8H4LM12_9HYPO|nr:hypothetical protein FALBO_3028 [Fusarium albosuccineum]KAF5000397.1 hypothetical protein FDECE_11217 [Fusarium decemcellulare]